MYHKHFPESITSHIHQLKGWTPSHTEDLKYMKQDIRNYVAKKKLINNSKYLLYFRLLKVATLCFDSAANPWPYLDERHDVVT